jgi:hypothetical protein
MLKILMLKPYKNEPSKFINTVMAVPLVQEVVAAEQRLKILSLLNTN